MAVSDHVNFNDFMEGVKRRNPGQPEFVQAVQEVSEDIFEFIEDKEEYHAQQILRRHGVAACIEAIAANGSVIELNTAGWHKPCAEAYPAPRFLELAASAGIGLVISSDAHAPAEVARDFGKAEHLAKAAGYRETQRFDKRKRTGEPCL